VVILTTFESDEYVYQALRAGASGFLVKDTEPEDLIRAVRVVARGDAMMSPSVTRRIITSLARQPQRAPARSGQSQSLSRLTEREREVLALVAEGLSNEEIAGRLFLSPLTTKTHVSRILTKVDARDRAQLVVMAYETGLVVPGIPTAPRNPVHRRTLAPRPAPRPAPPPGGQGSEMRRREWQISTLSRGS
jgi:DNA-binding NarL/FixJ family response regulator